MSQDNLLVLRCSECSEKNYYTYKNKKKLGQFKLEMNKHCSRCGKHTVHKEGKMKK
ncbi:MAG TPA: 50S ribosomal protein L33 [Candidatus Moranbacteria bacterium]|nr:50S ribosomal protein L33 [Candidatus Moranbacteria bacterium]